MADFQTLYGRVFRKGFDQLNDAGNGLADVKAALNVRYLDVCERSQWPWLYTDSTPGAAPVTITDLRAVLSVTNTTLKVTLPHMDRASLLDLYGDLTTAGTGVVWYRDSETVIRTYPADTTNTLAVRYVKVAAEMSGTSDVPLVPSRWQWVIVEGACADLHRDNQDFEASSACEQKFEQGVTAMLRSYSLDSLDGPDLVESFGNSVDG
jgi:hypothetical protein